MDAVNGGAVELFAGSVRNSVPAPRSDFIVLLARASSQRHGTKNCLDRLPRIQSLHIGRHRSLLVDRMELRWSFPTSANYHPHLAGDNWDIVRRGSTLLGRAINESRYIPLLLLCN